jgi:MrcB-like, N-terminal domain
MPLHSILTTILAEYPKAKIEPFGGNPLASFLRHQAADEVQNALGDLGAGLTVEGSAGAGNWAVAPCLETFLASQNCHAYQDNRTSIALQIHHRGAAHAV